MASHVLIDVRKSKLGTIVEICSMSPVFRGNKKERMRAMKHYEGIMSIGNLELKGLAIEESPNSLLVMAKKKIYVPEKKLILVEQATEQESMFLMSVTKNKGGLDV